MMTMSGQQNTGKEIKMEVRELKAKDVKTLAKMVGRLKSLDNIFDALEQKKARPTQVGIAIFKIIASDVTDDLYAWLADLIGKSVAELDEMPFDTPVKIFKELFKREGWRDFFGSALREGRISPSSTTLFRQDMDGQTEK